MDKIHYYLALPLLACAFSMPNPLHAQVGMTKAETAPPPTPSPGMPGSGTSTKQGMDSDSGAIRAKRTSPGIADSRSKRDTTGQAKIDVDADMRAGSNSGTGSSGKP